MSLRDLKIGYKLYAGSLSMLILFAVANGINFWGINFSNQSSDLLATRYQQITLFQELEQRNTGIILVMMEILLDKDTGKVSAERKTKLANIFNQIESEHQLLLAAADTKEEKANVELIIKNATALKNLAVQDLYPAIEQRLITPQFMERMDAQIDAKGAQNSQLIKAVTTSIQGEIEEARQSRMSALDQVNLWSTIVLVGGFAVGGLVAWLLTASLKTPIVEMIGLLKNIAEGDGDLTQRLNLNRKDEIGEIAYWNNRFLDNIQPIIREIQDLSATLVSSSEELSATATEMNQTTERIAEDNERNAAAVNQSTTSLQEFSAAIENITLKMREIKTKSSAINDGANRANDAAHQTDQSMKQIEQSSRKIEGIIRVITDIATQTNLLSLNAAIEAAKAGESGKGFAVVAEEVRSLAERSNNSVSEIQNLIETSSANVSQGISVIDLTVEVLQGIIAQISDITAEINEITVGVTQQEASVHEMTKSADEMAGTAENSVISLRQLSDATSEVAKTTEDLSQMALTLESKVGRFKV
ncbi:MAG: methyl-accepting chemotaxis protein [bacterium]|nr:methyl-accepting chemotaxis protein [bacterium]